MIDEARRPSRTRLLAAARHLMRAKGYAGTTVDDICRAADVTKGAFFHHFASKDEFALATVEHFSAMAGGLLAAAPYHDAAEPLQRLLGYVDFRAAILTEHPREFACLFGTLVQEAYDMHPKIRAACDRALSVHVAEPTRVVALAQAWHVPAATWAADSVGVFIQSVLQGAFVLAEATNGPQVVRDCLAHRRKYLTVLFESRPSAGAARDGPSAPRRRTAAKTKARAVIPSTRRRRISR